MRIVVLQQASAAPLSFLSPPPVPLVSYQFLLLFPLPHDGTVLWQLVSLAPGFENEAFIGVLYTTSFPSVWIWNEYALYYTSNCNLFCFYFPLFLI